LMDMVRKTSKALSDAGGGGGGLAFKGVKEDIKRSIGSTMNTKFCWDGIISLETFLIKNRGADERRIGRDRSSDGDTTEWFKIGIKGFLGEILDNRKRLEEVAGRVWLNVKSRGGVNTNTDAVTGGGAEGAKTRRTDGARTHIKSDYLGDPVGVDGDNGATAFPGGANVIKFESVSEGKFGLAKFIELFAFRETTNEVERTKGVGITRNKHEMVGGIADGDMGRLGDEVFNVRKRRKRRI
jgi:hypothetical protein